MVDEQQVSSLLDYLPAIFQEGSTPNRPHFLGRFLLAFERILLGLGDVSDGVKEPGLEEIIGGIIDPVSKTPELAGIERYFEPGVRLERVGDGLEEKLMKPSESTPAEFLPWLAGWVAFTLRQDWSDTEQRQFISRIVPLYQQRGTKAGLEQLLRAYTGLRDQGDRKSVEIREYIQPFVVGQTSTVGVETALAGGPPHYFLVKLSLTAPDPDARWRKEQIARAIIDREKPAHTYYDLEIEFPTLQIGVRSTVGTDMVLGSPSD